MKIRIGRELYARASACADDAKEPLSRWLWLCTRPGNIRRGLEAHPENPYPLALCPAGGDPVVATMETVYEDHDVIRRDIARQVIYCESRRRPAPANTLMPHLPGTPRPGIDYHLASEES